MQLCTYIHFQVQFASAIWAISLHTVHTQQMVMASSHNVHSQQASTYGIIRPNMGMCFQIHFMQ